MNASICNVDPRREGGATDRGDADRHQVAAPEKWPWLPTQEDQGLAKHPYCEECGSVKALGSESGLKFGTIVNIVGRLRRRLRDLGHTVTEAQQRLILQRLRVEDADDRFAIPRSGQLRLIVEAVHDHTELDEDLIRDVLRSC